MDRAGPQHEGAEQPADLVERYAGRVYRFLLGMTRDAEMARDLTQETFLKLFRMLRSRPEPPPEGEPPASDGDPGGWPAAGYVFAVARNTALSALRHREVEARHEHALPVEEQAAREQRAGASRRVERTELRAALHAALGTLPEELRAVFLLSEIEGLKYTAIAQLMQCPVGTVGSRKHQAVQVLRREMGRRGHGTEWL